MVKDKLSQTVMILLCISAIIGVTVYSKDDTETLQYFPLDQTYQFLSADTLLTLLQETSNDQYRISWQTNSELDEPVYLRQDVSLLYMDGVLKGINGVWKEDVEDLTLTKDFEESDSSHFQAITLHHGEIHYPDDEIKSIQTMSNDYLYVIDSPHTPLESFRQPKNKFQRDWKQTIDHATQQQLQYTWKRWIEEAEIDINRYQLVPLVEIVNFQSEAIPGLGQEATDRIMGQLWEGLYRNYILPVSSSPEQLHQPMPLILMEKQNDHLIVLFQNEEKELERLYQVYSN
ncbi:hypothetical protein J416_05648 [Gracilibacillus halophilus YIM-C55.5]|uniref:Uncharacterized protein n=1 Tax=Gracilibacillus halophilus YIM-C55.5 TaxID=1308866 RepID=N4WSY8_9BACI|nr:hypothetical protein [Gracilibacillus halophilus]ENH97470.1 hypothetical protein J416_05648 [Gracilibacillus halophilus YIM-C55.5]